MASKKPPIDASGVRDPMTRRALERIIETLETGEGKRRNTDEVWLKRSDLNSRGMLLRLVTGLKNNGIDIPSGSNNENVDLTPPEAPTGFATFRGFDSVYMRWNNSTDRRVGSALVYRHSTDNRGLSTLIGVTSGTVYQDVDVVRGQSYYYWVRYLNRWSDPAAPVYSDYNATDGTEGYSALDPTALLEALEDKITDAELYGDLKDAVAAVPGLVTVLDGLTQKHTIKIVTDSETGQKLIGGFGLLGTQDEFTGETHSEAGFLVDQFWIGSPNNERLVFVVDTENNRVVMSGAFIQEATIESAAIKELAVDKLIGNVGDWLSINANMASIFDLVLDGQLRTDDYQPGQSGILMTKNGYLEMNDALFRGVINGSTINGGRINGAFITGSVIASDTDTTVPTEYDDGSFTLLAYARVLSDFVEITQSNSILTLSTGLFPIASPNDDDVENFYRYVHSDVSPEIFFSFTNARAPGSGGESGDEYAANAGYVFSVRQGDNTIWSSTITLSSGLPFNGSGTVTAIESHSWGTVTKTRTVVAGGRYTSQSIRFWSFHIKLDSITFTGNDRMFATVQRSAGPSALCAYVLRFSDDAQNV